MSASNLLTRFGHRLNTQAYWLADKQVMRVLVTVLDVKDSFGHIRFLITPVQGEGEKWIDAKYIEFLD